MSYQLFGESSSKLFTNWVKTRTSLCISLGCILLLQLSFFHSMCFVYVYVWFRMALITTMVLCTRSQDSSVSVCTGYILCLIWTWNFCLKSVPDELCKHLAAINIVQIIQWKQQQVHFRAWFVDQSPYIFITAPQPNTLAMEHNGSSMLTN